LSLAFRLFKRNVSIPDLQYIRENALSLRKKGLSCHPDSHASHSFAVDVVEPKTHNPDVEQDWSHVTVCECLA